MFAIEKNNKKILGTPPVYISISVILILFFYFAFSKFNIINYPYNLLGIIFILIGLYISFLGYILFKKEKTTILYKKSEKFIESGIYKYSRNPMYVGFLSIILGLAIIFGNILGLISPLLFFLIHNYMIIPYEERKCEIEFGKKYLKYKNKVRRWI